MVRVGGGLCGPSDENIAPVSYVLGTPMYTDLERGATPCGYVIYMNNKNGVTNDLTTFSVKQNLIKAPAESTTCTGP